MREQMPLVWKLKLLILFSPLTEWIERTQFLRLRLREKTLEYGRQERTPASRNKIESFIKFYNINMNDFEPSDSNAYATFEEFFTRSLKPGSRTIHDEDNPCQAVVVADSRVVVFDSVAITQSIWIKGKQFSIQNLTLEPKLSKVWSDGAVASFRLSPQDYHRYHSPVEGTLVWWKQIPGEYYNVDAIALRSNVDILTSNARSCACISTKAFGQVLFVAIGATGVGTVKFHDHFRKEGSKIKKGEEVGMFEFGGSSIIVAFEKGRILFDEDLISVSKRAITVNVEVGMRLGKALISA